MAGRGENRGLWPILRKTVSNLTACVVSEKGQRIMKTIIIFTIELLIEHYNLGLFLLISIAQNDVLTAAVWTFWGVKAVSWALKNAAERDGQGGWM